MVAPDHVVRVLRPDGLGHNVLDAQHFEFTGNAFGPPAILIPVPSGAVPHTNATGAVDGLPCSWVPM